MRKSKFEQAIDELVRQRDGLTLRANALNDAIQAMREAAKAMPSKRQRKPKAVENEA